MLNVGILDFPLEASIVQSSSSELRRTALLPPLEYCVPFASRGARLSRPSKSYSVSLAASLHYPHHKTVVTCTAQ